MTRRAPRAAAAGQEPLGSRDRLLHAAESLFSRQGFHHTQILDITREASAGVGTFYRYFKDKDDILYVLLDEIFTHFRGRMADLRRGLEQLPPIEQVAVLRQTFRMAFEAHMARPELTLTWFRHGYGVNERIDGVIWGFITDIVRDFASDFERLGRTGLMAVPDKPALAMGLVGMTHYLVHRMVVEGTPTIDEAVNLCTRFALGGLLAFAPDDRLSDLLPLLRLATPSGA